MDGQPVAEVAGFQKIMEKIEKDRPKSTVLTVKRGIGDMFIELRPSWPRTPSSGPKQTP